MSATDNNRAKFFRQSGWMASATLAGGICMFAVHVLYPVLGEKEYGLFTTLLGTLNVLTIPALGLQATLAQQTASAVTPADEARLTATVRAVLGWAAGLWLAFAAVVWLFHGWIMEKLIIPSPYALGLVAAFTLCLLVQPVLFGVLQGRQNFLWLGWALITNGAGRLLMAILLVMAATQWWKLPALAVQALTGALMGIAASVLLAGWHTRSTWGQRQRVAFEWRPFLKLVVPLTLGLGAFQFLFSVDVMFVRNLYLENQTGNYNAAGTLARGLVMFTAPLAVVMFPKIVHSRATGKKSKVLWYTLISVLVLSMLVATGCTVVAWGMSYVAAHPDFSPGWVPAGWLVALRGKTETLRVLGRLIPWFVWAMVPLALGNVLLNNLLAHKRYRVVPYLLVTVALYALAIRLFAQPIAAAGDYSHFVRIIQILGISNLVFAGLCAIFTKLEQADDELSGWEAR